MGNNSQNSYSRFYPTPRHRWVGTKIKMQISQVYQSDQARKLSLPTYWQGLAMQTMPMDLHQVLIELQQHVTVGPAPSKPMLVSSLPLRASLLPFRP